MELLEKLSTAEGSLRLIAATEGEAAAIARLTLRLLQTSTIPAAAAVTVPAPAQARADSSNAAAGKPSAAAGADKKLRASFWAYNANMRKVSKPEISFDEYLARRANGFSTAKKA